MKGWTGIAGSLFLDTSGLVAAFNARDQNHRIASDYYRGVGRRLRLTTDLIIAETHARLLVRGSREVASRFLHAVDEAERLGLLRVIYNDPERGIRARSYIARYHDVDLSYCDAVSFATILEPRSRVSEVFTFDRHFLLTGRTIVPAVT